MSRSPGCGSRWPAPSPSWPTEPAPGTARRAQAAPEPTLERPKRAEFGDYSTNAALLLAPRAGRAAARAGRAARRGARRAGSASEPRALRGRRAGLPEPVPVRLAGCARALAEVLAAGDALRRAAAPSRAERVLVEFVSANPTGPMHVGHARNAAYGDALARMLAFHGHRVEREFYVNDAGSPGAQARRVDRRARARARRCPRTATAATTSPSSPASCRAPPRCPRPSSGARPSP